MQPGDDRAHALAHRLRALREEQWPDVSITQGQLGRALGRDKPLSVALVSSWENLKNPKTPPIARLSTYATFFATHRSVEKTPFRVLDLSELTAAERDTRAELNRELIDLRGVALHSQRPQAEAMSPSDPIGGGPWYLPDRRDITIVCAGLPDYLREKMPYTNPDSPDYVALYSYADLDTLLELHGHIRAVNPHSQVVIRIATELVPDDYTTHLVLLGGVDWNVATRELLDRIDLPVRQIERDTEFIDGCFEVTDGVKIQRFAPKLAKSEEREVLLEDVAHFFRAPNPFNKKRTVTICNGMFGRGTYGAARTLTDARFRDRNEAYLHDRFPKQDTFSILTRVLIVNGQVVTPDWTDVETRLHEWPGPIG